MCDGDWHGHLMHEGSCHLSMEMAAYLFPAFAFSPSYGTQCNINLYKDALFLHVENTSVNRQENTAPG